jgi:hypothetical protein
MNVARIGTGSLLWWKAQARRRNSTLERVGRPLVAAEIFALLVVAAATIWVAASQWHSFVGRVVSAEWWPILSLNDAWGVGTRAVAGRVRSSDDFRRHGRLFDGRESLEVSWMSAVWKVRMIANSLPVCPLIEANKDVLTLYEAR